MPKQDTQWNQILQQHGIIKQDSSNVDNNNEYTYIKSKSSSSSKHAQHNVDSEESDFDLDEDDAKFMEKYRQKRLKELKKHSSNSSQKLEEISAHEFVQRVSNASAHSPVILLLYQQSVKACEEIEKCLCEIKRKIQISPEYSNFQAEPKFLKIIATQCIPNYPHRLVPTVLVYHKEDILGQLVGLGAFGGIEGAKSVKGKCILPVYLHEWLVSGCLCKYIRIGVYVFCRERD